MATRAPAAGDSLGALLRSWRARRGRSQLEVALDAGVSQRHISFIESGRSTPSRSLLLGIARVLDVPLRDRNGLLLAAGFAPMYSERAWDAGEMRAVQRALARVLRQHEPYPAVVMDRYWNVLASNDYAPRLFGQFIDMAARRGQRNLLRLMFDPDGMRPFIADWPQVAAALFDRIRRESVGGSIDDATRSLMAELLAYPEVEPDPNARDAVGSGPVIPIRFIKQGRLLSYFSLISTVGTPQAVSAQELRVECMFPADDETEEWHLRTFAPE